MENEEIREFIFSKIGPDNIPIANMIAFYLAMRGDGFESLQKAEPYVFEKYRRYILSDKREEWLWGLHHSLLRTAYIILRDVKYKFNEEEAKYLFESRIIDTREVMELILTKEEDCEKK